MPAVRTAPVLRYIRKLATADGGSELPDQELLERFIAHRDEAAFEALVRRHGPMLLHLCRRILGNQHDAEDCFQAVFLVLARKAAALRRQQAVGSWLYGIAYRLALKSKAAAARRRAREGRRAQRPEADPIAEITLREAQELLDRELVRLPEKLRAPLLLCCLEGLTRDEAARQLGCSVSILKCRLEQGRQRLRARLAKRGLSRVGALGALLLGEQTTGAAVPISLLSSTVSAATTIAAGGAATCVVSTKVAALMEGVLKTMLLTKLKLAIGLAVLLVLGIAAVTWDRITFLCNIKGQEPKPVPQANRARASSQTERPKPPAAANPAQAGRIYFHRNRDLTTVQPDGQAMTHWNGIPDGLHRYQVHSARLSPDGKRLAFGLAVETVKDGIMGIAAPDNIHVWQVGAAAPEQLVHMEGAGLANWSWSRDGAKLAFSSSDSENTRNWIVDAKTKKVEEVKLPRFKHEDKEYTMGIQAWSPDGAWFLAQGDGLHLVKTDGSASRRLIKRKDILDGTCRFSPDGRQVLFATVDLDQENTVFRSMALHVVDVADGKTRPVVDAKNFGNIHACWSPDSRRIAYCARMLNPDLSCAGETSIFVTDPDGKNTVTVATEKHEPNVIALQLTDWR